jgi:hypothetical protein
MRYFKVKIIYEIPSPEDNAPQFEQVLYCCDPYHFPTTAQLRDLFYSLDGVDKKYLSATWHAVREEEIPTNEIHLL